METLAEKFITDANGKKISVILSFKKYKKLMEDLNDLAVIAERRDEKSVSLDEMKKKLKKDGLI
jgi:hypothetical protein